MEKELGRRNLLGRAGLALGGLVTLGALQACGGDSSDSAPVVPPAEPPAEPQPLKVSQFPYAQHMAAGVSIDVDAVRAAAYAGYWNGGCCHGAYSALLGQLAAKFGDPFDKLPVDFGKFGGGGIAGNGSICGAILGAALVTNMVVADVPATATSPAVTIRNPMLLEQMRWYERTAFPAYVPATPHAKEAGTVFTTRSLAALQLAPGSHLCHASVSKWCNAANVSPASNDKLSRCARLTADVAGKVAEMLNGYLAARDVAFTPSAVDSGTGLCGSCHKPAAGTGTLDLANPGTYPGVASGMSCSSCHPNPQHPF